MPNLRRLGTALQGSPPASDGILRLSLRPAGYPRFSTTDTYVVKVRAIRLMDRTSRLGSVAVSLFPHSHHPRSASHLKQPPPSLPPPNIATDLSGGNVSLLPLWVLPGSLTRPRLPQRASCVSPSVLHRHGFRPQFHAPSTSHNAQRPCYHPIYCMLTLVPRRSHLRHWTTCISPLTIINLIPLSTSFRLPVHSTVP